MNKIETLIAEGKTTVEQELRALIVKCNILKRERDEARLEVCKRVESASCLSDGEPTTTASDYARWCGWDCFKEDGKPCQ
jgi:hypothetical protein